MNKRKISERLAKIHKEWVESITDPIVKNLADKNSIITGGAIVSLLQNQEPNDYDIYFTDKETTIAVAEYYVKKVDGNAKVLDGHKYFQEREKYPNWDEVDQNKFWWFTEKIYNMTKDRVRIFIESAGVLRYPKMDKEKIEKGIKQFKPVFISSNAITLSDKVQLINRFYGPPEKIHDTFDFLHAFNYWKSSNGELYLNTDSLECILDKRLVYKGSKYPLCSIIRLRKFINRGWHINAGQILKICYQLSQLDLDDIEVLEDQLIGVDTWHFAAIIGMIQLEIKTNKDFKIDETVVAKLVDEIFG